MRGVDLDRFQFDFDLTFAALIAHPDGRIYHRYGSRDRRSADRWLSPASFERFLRAGLERHALELQASTPEPGRSLEPGRSPEPGRSLEQVPAFAKRDRGKCIHCHSVNTSLYEESLGQGGPPPGWIWRHPDPLRIGLDLDRDEQVLVTEVVPGSGAAAAGLRVGDRLRSVGGVPLATASDLMFALERTPASSTPLSITFERDGQPYAVRAQLEDGWKIGTPLDFAWRPLKWALTPAPGFGGASLNAAQKRALGLPPEPFAFRVDYLVTWGDNARYGRAAQAAGIELGDVVLAIDGRSDFASIDHVHAWWRLEVEFGDTVTIETLRGKQRRTVRLTAVR